MPSELERRRLRATKGQLDRRWTMVGSLLSARLDRPRWAIVIEADYQGLAFGQGCVAKARSVSRAIAASQVSSHLRRCPKASPLGLDIRKCGTRRAAEYRSLFRQAGITIHVGEVGDPMKPQLLRLEWPGLRDWDRSGVGFQSPGAGHPHWQIDLFESLHALREPAAFDPEFVEAIEDFGALPDAPSLPDRIARLTFERMHLASAAPWWSEGPAEFVLHHLNAPSDEVALSRWLGYAIAYVRQELSRCVMRR